MGLKRRVSIGFMSIVGVLILSGMVSFVELTTLSHDTDRILDLNAEYGHSSAVMVDALGDHNRLFVHMVAFEDRSLDTLCIESINRLDSALVVARQEAIVPDIIDTMMFVASELRAVSQEYISAPNYDSHYDVLMEEFPLLDSLSVDFGRRIYDKYLPIYDEMLALIDMYSTESLRTLAPGAEQLHNNAYRAVTPILLSLLVMIVIVLMLYYFIMSYCVSPVVKINNALKDYLSYKVPFDPKAGQRDELQELTERIELLIKQSKITNKES